MPEEAGTGGDAGALEDNLMTPAEDKALLTDRVMTKPATQGLIQRDEGEPAEKSQEDQEKESEANLTGATLTGATVTETDFTDATLDDVVGHAAP